MAAKQGERRAEGAKGAAHESARGIALEAVIRIERDGAYANLLLQQMLSKSKLETRDRGFVTELVYGSTRMSRACDYLANRFIADPPPVEAVAALRLGVYQLVFLGTPPHAAVNDTVEVTPHKFRGLVNAVLRKVIDAPVSYPTDAIALSYPDWLFDLFIEQFGDDKGRALMASMNEPAEVVERDDGYRQDRSSQMVAALVAGDRVADICAAPGGKSTYIAGPVGGGALVMASDRRLSRTRLVSENSARLALDNVTSVVADGRQLPYRPGSFDTVLVDAPCTGLGALRRRADARWRIGKEDAGRLSSLQVELILAAADLVAEGGEIIYSVCTVTDAESIDVGAKVAELAPHLVPFDDFPEGWERHGTGARLLPDADNDGMAVIRFRKTGSGD